MQCEDCLGTGTVLLRTWPGGALQPYPCWVCGGSGLAHCCEGERPDNPPPPKVHPSLVESAGFDEAILRYFYEPDRTRSAGAPKVGHDGGSDG
jgi:hypothetical protein